jgi:DNA-binding transcriptional LysR family regulator
MEIGHLRYFYSVAKQGGFTGAAKALRTSQPSISKIIKQIEEDQGIKLFDRGTRHVRLTEVGKRYLESCETIFGEFEKLHRVSESHKNIVSGRAALSASDNLCNYVLPPLFKKFLAKYAEVQIKLNSGTAQSIKAEISSGKSDFGLFYTPVEDAGFDVQRAGFVEFVIVLGGELKRIEQKPAVADTLRDICYIGSHVGDYAKPYPVLRMLSSIGVKAKVLMEVNSQESQKKLVLQGIGYTVLPLFMVQEELRKHSLVRVDCTKKLGTELLFVKKKNRALPLAADVLSKFLVSSVADSNLFLNGGAGPR